MRFPPIGVGRGDLFAVRRAPKRKAPLSPAHPSQASEYEEEVKDMMLRSEQLRSVIDKSLPPMETKPTTGEILNAILPAREWVEDGVCYAQFVSHKQAQRFNVAELTKHLNFRLTNRQARHNKNDICPIKEEIYGQCFEEIIRQVTISEPDRGLLLLRVRDDIKNTISAYRTLYESSMIFSMRKQLQAEFGMPELEKRYLEL